MTPSSLSSCLLFSSECDNVNDGLTFILLPRHLQHGRQESLRRMESSSSEIANKESSASCFVELRPEPQDPRPPTIEALAMEVEPRDCSKVVKQLAHLLPFGDDLSHLKRVRKPTASTITSPTENNNEAPTKKPKLLLQVLLGTENTIKDYDDLPKKLEEMLETPFVSLVSVTVPGRPPQSQSEAREFKGLWPTNFFPLKSDEHKQQQLALSQSEESFMKHIMNSVVLAHHEVVLVDPSKQQIVARSKDEQQQQQSIHNNPLATPILLALQGVSRLERQAATTKSKEDFTKGQYLCTGYDLYTYYEPSVFEAMACVHYRLRRLVYYNNNKEDGCGVWRHACSRHSIHCLPGTNHQYRAFEYHPKREEEAKSSSS
jgi:tRNA-specific adenosine deaminase 3